MERLSIAVKDAWESGTRADCRWEKSRWGAEAAEYGKHSGPRTAVVILREVEHVQAREEGREMDILRRPPA
ncbi:hypothetical protein NDU88_005857 [Pleurodeles waltl]|uniref:Uncharacterized protein n=1 Tax=Pleurodeles waltl TaxID=8319 RepID=A0AAV7QGA2_PLEWA|nr:hypothetical protein NDU88_005857 [Pleurodeles waltl]